MYFLFDLILIRERNINEESVKRNAVLRTVTLAAPQILLLLFLISNFRLVLNVVFFLLGNSPASEFHESTDKGPP